MQAAPGTHGEVTAPRGHGVGVPSPLGPGDPGLLCKSRGTLGWAEHCSQALQALPWFWCDEQIQISLRLEQVVVQEGLCFTTALTINNFTLWKPLVLNVCT